MSCLTTSATRRPRSVPAAVLIASAAASSHEVLLVPMISVTLYTLMTLSFDHMRPASGLLPPACHRATLPGHRCRQVIAGTPTRVAPGASPVTAVPDLSRARDDHCAAGTPRSWPMPRLAAACLLRDPGQDRGNSGEN